MGRSENVMTPPFRVSYPNVFKARLNDMNDKMEYGLVALFPKGADLSALKAAARKAIVEEWGDNKAKWPKPLRLPFRDQAEKEKELEDGTKQMPDGHVAGAIFMNLKTTQMPGLIDQKKQPIIDGEEFYAGCWARATINAYTYDAKGNKGVSFGLNNIQKVKDDEPLSGRRKAEEEFEAIAESEDDLTADTAADDGLL